MITVEYIVFELPKQKPNSEQDIRNNVFIKFRHPEIGKERKDETKRLENVIVQGTTEEGGLGNRVQSIKDIPDMKVEYLPEIQFDQDILKEKPNISGYKNDTKPNYMNTSESLKSVTLLRSVIEKFEKLGYINAIKKPK